MKTNVKNQKNEVVNNEVIATKKTTKKAVVKVENPIDFKSTQGFNKLFKNDLNSLGKVRSNILAFNNSLPLNSENRLSPLLVELLDKMRIQKNYEFVKANFLPNKKGEFSSYKLLMYFRKNLALIQGEFSK